MSSNQVHMDGTLPSGVGQSVYIQPLADGLPESAETVTLTLVETNDYLILSSQASASISVKDFSTRVYFGSALDAIEPDGPPGVAARTGPIDVFREDDSGRYPALTVAYAISGSAGNGTDYATLSGTLTFAEGATATNMVINPVDDSLVEGLETVTLTLQLTNTFLADTNSVTATIVDTTTRVSVQRAIDGDAVEPNASSNIPKKGGHFYDHSNRLPV